MHNRCLRSFGEVAGMLVMLAACYAALPAAAEARNTPVTDVVVQVTDASTHKPVFQAQLTLAFRDPQSRTGKTISFTAKTNLRGEYKFTFIPMETVDLYVTDPDHQSFGRRFLISQQNQVIRVELRRPQPLR
jgi:hypothetical protein